MRAQPSGATASAALLERFAAADANAKASPPSRSWRQSGSVFARAELAGRSGRGGRASPAAPRVRALRGSGRRWRCPCRDAAGIARRAAERPAPVAPHADHGASSGGVAERQRSLREAHRARERPLAARRGDDHREGRRRALPRQLVAGFGDRQPLGQFRGCAPSREQVGDSQALAGANAGGEVERAHARDRRARIENTAPRARGGDRPRSRKCRCARGSQEPEPRQRRDGGAPHAGGDGSPPAAR